MSTEDELIPIDDDPYWSAVDAAVELMKFDEWEKS